ncbi:iron-sulfur cluster assembly protein [Skermanella mucosa]|uniref:metal-sulfur cluster assembly factor n=1 Tax=Skermanella mucosa TaxID=1789672 RepID=UPI00192B5B99|nr:iron-sulfur cluster assembly protein [Skermanella mucosa]UEM19642.1 iron-sulfur cluster assembly protein [Skermanella mucosa]
MTVHVTPGDPRAAEVWASLASVTDPELDESVTELRFVTQVEVDAEDRVHIGFRLPTYWCAANFAFLMADDMRVAVSSLPWVRQVLVDLRDHMYSDTINEGLAKGRSFKSTFSDEAANEDLDDLRRTFRIKAFQRRQEAVVRYLLDRDWTVQAILDLDCTHLATLAIDDAEAARQRDRYLEIRREFGGPGDMAFTTAQGEPIDPRNFAEYLSLLRRVRINTEFNGHLCRGLLQARYGDPAPDGEPTLADFIAGRVATQVAKSNTGGNDGCRK